MALVDQIYSQWLQADGLWLVVEDAGNLARWAQGAVTAERMTCIALSADAQTEAQRQLAFLRGPLAVEAHQMLGAWAWSLGQVITIAGDKLGYDAGLDVFVIGAEDNLATGLSTVTVLRRL